MTAEDGKGLRTQPSKTGYCSADSIGSKIPMAIRRRVFDASLYHLA
jgi:hypothetical protein